MEEAIEPDDIPLHRESARLCALARESLPMTALLRFVIGPDEIVVPDIRNKLPGRGMWLRTSSQVIQEAIKKNLFSKVFRKAVGVPDGLESKIEQLLKQDALNMLSMANKAGGVVSGFAKVSDMSGTVLALVQARDGSPQEISRLRGHLRGRGPKRSDPALVNLFSAEELALSIGREHVIHAALISSEVCRATLARMHRYDTYSRSGVMSAGDMV